LTPKYSHSLKMSGKIKIPSEQQLQQRLRAAMMSVQQQGPSPQTEEVTQWVLAADSKLISSWSQETRLGTAQWLLMSAGMMVAMVMQNPNAASQNWSALETQYMRKAWELLDIEADGELARVLDMMRLNVAQKLGDSENMTKCFERAYARGPTDANPEELMAVFSASPFVGRWKECYELGKTLQSSEKLKAQGDPLQMLHEMAMQMMVPDFAVVHGLVEELKLHEKPSMPADKFMWGAKTITNVRIKLDTIECDNDAKKKEVREQIEPGWQDQGAPEKPADTIRHMGAIAQMMSFSAIGMPLIGVLTDEGRLVLKGWSDMALQPHEDALGPNQIDPSKLSEDNLIRQTEGFDLKQDAERPNVWVGTYSDQLWMKKDPSTGKETNVKCTFLAEIHLSEDCLAKPTQDNGNLAAEMMAIQAGVHQSKQETDDQTDATKSVEAGIDDLSLE